MNFNLKFKNLRKSIGCNQKEFGVMFGLTQQSISDLESGRKKPSKTLMAFLKYRYSDIFSSPESALDKSIKEEQPAASNKVITILNEHQDLVKQFKNPKKAKEVNEDLLILEEVDESGYEEVHEIIKRKIERKGGAKKKQTSSTRKADGA